MALSFPRGYLYSLVDIMCLTQIIDGKKIQSDGTFNFGNQLKLMNIIFSLPGNIPSYPAKSNYLLFVSVLLSILINIFDRLFHQQLQR